MEKNFFKDLKILDHTRYLLGGYCTQVFADLGAEVIKIEDTNAGDFCRLEEPLQNGVSYYFAQLNRNKKSLSINLKNETAKKAYLELVKEADIVVENFRPCVMDRLGIGYGTEKELNPKIIHCSMSGFGKDDPRSLNAMHDINFQALAGYLSLNGNVTQPMHLVDLSASMVSIQSIMAALLQRTQTGEGAYVDTKMFDSFVWWNSLCDSRYWFDGCKADKDHLDFPALAYNVYETKDGGYVTLAMLEDKFWDTFLEAVDAVDLRPYKRSLRADAPEAFAKMEEIIRARTLDEWKEFLSDKDICAMWVHTKKEAIDYILNSDTGLMKVCDFPLGKELHTRIPHAVEGLSASLDYARPAPALGEHTQELLKRAGLSDHEIKTVAAEGGCKIA